MWREKEGVYIVVSGKEKLALFLFFYIYFWERIKQVKLKTKSPPLDVSNFQRVARKSEARNRLIHSISLKKKRMFLKKKKGE